MKRLQGLYTFSKPRISKLIFEEYRLGKFKLDYKGLGIPFRIQQIWMIIKLQVEKIFMPYTPYYFIKET